MNTTFTRSSCALTTLMLTSAAFANPVSGTYFDTPGCDNHGLLQAFEELGTAPMFPADELISAVETVTQQSACPITDDPTMINALVEIRNLSGREWTDLFYVGDPETRFSNVDGEAFSAAAPAIPALAFRIDAVGSNRPLVFESMTADGVFEVGETWQFIIQDYDNPFGVGASGLGSLDFAGASGLNPLSSGSIVQFQVPGPSALAAFGAASIMVGRRRRASK